MSNPYETPPSSPKGIPKPFISPSSPDSKKPKFGSPKSIDFSPEHRSITYDDWTTQLKCCTIKSESGNSISVATLPKGSMLFRVVQNPNIIFNTEDVIAWFGNYEEYKDFSKHKYGTHIYRFDIPQDINLINMQDVNTIKALNALLPRSTALIKAFPINDGKIKRASELKHDVTLAKELKGLLFTKNIHGWYHTTMKGEHSIFPSEIMLFDYHFAGSPIFVPPNREQRLSAALAQSSQNLKRKNRHSEPTKRYDSDSD